MFYSMIQKACEAWYASGHCPAESIIRYIEEDGHLRDAQVEAIRTYLFLKLAGRNHPLYTLFTEGFFCTQNLDELPLSVAARESLQADPARIALYAYSCSTDANGHRLAPRIAKAIEANETLDSCRFFRQAFGDKNYTEYLFSLPMGAGKTYLMAAFIYLDLYYAMMEPDNPAFAHNFIVLAPSGLKSSVVPSLRTIQRFDPHWVLPEPAASQVKRLLKFEVLDAQKSAKRSNKVRNPNVQKIALHRSDPNLMGLVAVTNAEKVILDRVKVDDGQLNLYEETDDDRDRQANELRNIIGKLPGLAVYVDEAHHAADDDIKLRSVINHWMAQNRSGVRGVIGFSGTPYLAKKEDLSLSDALSVKSEEIPTIVHYYSLIDGIGNFLKYPVVHRASPGTESVEIVNRGIRDFLDKYKDTVYANGCTAKLAIFCSSIASLEGIYSDVANIVEQYGMNASETILKFHRGNKQFPQPEGAQLAFDSLDTVVSRKRIIMLAGIGKEGWDCRSLTGVILSQKGACPLNKVLQTTCRCLRQVDKGKAETALIYLNAENEKLLAAQLKKQQHTTVEEFQKKPTSRETVLSRYHRMDHLHLPEIPFRQLRISYTAEISQRPKNIDRAISQAVDADALRHDEMRMQDFSGQVLETRRIAYGEKMPTPAVYPYWLNGIVKESMNTLTIEELTQHDKALRKVFRSITEEQDGICYYRNDIWQNRVRVNIRRAFTQDWHYVTREETIPMHVPLLNVANFTDSVLTVKPEEYYPEQKDVQRILEDDRGAFQLPDAMAESIRMAEQDHHPEIARMIRAQYGLIPGKDRSFHYLPYHMDSAFEIQFLREVLPEDFLERQDLEIYYNGDRSLTAFRIRCYEKIKGRGWNYVGMYTPDFLMLQREQRRIARVLIIETKGSLYAGDLKYQKRREFMETTFKKLNPNYDYLYLEDSLSDLQRHAQLRNCVEHFFRPREAK